MILYNWLKFHKILQYNEIKYKNSFRFHVALMNIPE